MAKLVGRLRSLKQLVVDIDQEEDNGVCIQTPTDSCVRHAEASIPVPDMSGGAPQGGSSSRTLDVIQTPTSLDVADAEADVAESPSSSQQSGNSAGGLMGLLARRLSRVRTFHGSYDELDGMPHHQRKSVSFSASHHSQPGRSARRRGSLHSSASQPELAAAVSGVPPSADASGLSPTIMVLGKEARRRSERRRATFAFAGDEAPRSPVSPPQQPKMGAPAPEGSAKSHTRALYNMVAPLRSPFADIPHPSAEGSSPSAAASSSQPDQAPLSSPSTRERLMLQRKISSNKLIVSTDTLEQKPGDIMLAPEVVEFASEALHNMGGHYTGEIEFSGRSARVARRLSSHRSTTVRAMAAAVAAA